MWFSIWQNNMFCLADTHLFRGRPKKQSFGMGSGGFLEWGYPQTISNHPVMDDHDLVLKPMTWEYTISRNPHFLRDNKKALLGWQTMFFWRGHNSSFRPRNILWYGDMEVSYIGGWPWLSIETTCRWRLGIHHFEKPPFPGDQIRKGMPYQIGQLRLVHQPEPPRIVVKPHVSARWFRLKYENQLGGF